MNSPLIIASIASIFLAILKLGAYFATGSMIVLSSFFDSSMDSVISFINHKVFNQARKAADYNHPYGHGGFEVVAAVVQASVIFSLALYVMLKSAMRLINTNTSISIEGSTLKASGVMILAALGGYLIHKGLDYWKENAEERSLSVEADQGHFMTDIWLNLFGAAGLLLVWYFKDSRIDSALGIVSSLFLLHVSYEIFTSCLGDILQTKVEDHILQEIADAIMQSDRHIMNVHRLRVRRSGPTLYIDFHMKLPRQLNLAKAHMIEEKVRAKLTRKYLHSDIFIHLDPDSETDDDIHERSYQVKERKNILEDKEP